MHANRRQSVADLVELERLDDGHDYFHGIDSPGGPLRTDGAVDRNAPRAIAPSLLPGSPIKPYAKLGFFRALDVSYWSELIFEARRGRVADPIGSRAQ
jgi:hypothetical protein